MSIGLMVNRVAIRWSRAANIPMRSWRLKVGWPTKMPAKGEEESISELVNSAALRAGPGRAGGPRRR